MTQLCLYVPTDSEVEECLSILYIYIYIYIYFLYVPAEARAMVCRQNLARCTTGFVDHDGKLSPLAGLESVDKYVRF